MDTILKVECEGDLRRALLKGSLNYAAIDRAVQEIWPQRNASEAKYADEVGDMLTLTEQTCMDFVGSAKKTATGQVLKLQLASAPAPSEEDSARSATDDFSSPWQRVEQGSDVGDEGLHTVADLTDIQEDDLAPRTGAGYRVPDAAAAPQETAEHNEDRRTAEDDQQTDEFLLMNVPADTGFQVQADMCAEDTGFQMQGDVVAGLEDANREFEEHVDIVIAAFDEDGDGFLSFAECSALLQYNVNKQLPQHVFQQMCTDAGADANVGLGRDALTCIYTCGNSWMGLDRDFQAAKSKLEGLSSEELSRQRAQASAATPISLVMKNPLLAPHFALDYAERLRQGVASQILVGRS